MSSFRVSIVEAHSKQYSVVGFAAQKSDQKLKTIQNFEFQSVSQSEWSKNQFKLLDVGKFWRASQVGN